LHRRLQDAVRGDLHRLMISRMQDARAACDFLQRVSAALQFIRKAARPQAFDQARKITPHEEEAKKLLALLPTA
jgi:hypothetical protein